MNFVWDTTSTGSYGVVSSPAYFSHAEGKNRLGMKLAMGVKYSLGGALFTSKCMWGTIFTRIQEIFAGAGRGCKLQLDLYTDF